MSTATPTPVVAPRARKFVDELFASSDLDLDYAEGVSAITVGDDVMSVLLGLSVVGDDEVDEVRRRALETHTLTAVVTNATLTEPDSDASSGKRTHAKQFLERSKASATNLLRLMLPLHAEFLLALHARFGKFVHKHEVPRKVFHVLIGFITLYLYTIGVQVQQLVVPLLTAFVLIALVDYARLNSPALNQWYCSAMGFLMREREVHTYNGVIWYLLGLVLVFIKCPKDVLVMAVLLLSWLDTAASTFGRAFGYLTPKVTKNKSLAGLMAAFVTGVLSAFLLYGYFLPQYPQWNAGYEMAWTAELSLLGLPALALVSGLVAAVSEGIDIFGWDDNFTIPVISGYVLWGVTTLLKK